MNIAKRLKLSLLSAIACGGIHAASASELLGNVDVGLMSYCHQMAVTKFAADAKGIIGAFKEGISEIEDVRAVNVRRDDGGAFAVTVTSSYGAKSLKEHVKSLSVSKDERITDLTGRLTTAEAAKTAADALVSKNLANQAAAVVELDGVRTELAAATQQAAAAKDAAEAAKRDADAQVAGLQERLTAAIQRAATAEQTASQQAADATAAKEAATTAQAAELEGLKQQLVAATQQAAGAADAKVAELEELKQQLATAQAAKDAAAAQVIITRDALMAEFEERVMTMNEEFSARLDLSAQMSQAAPAAQAAAAAQAAPAAAAAAPVDDRFKAFTPFLALNTPTATRDFLIERMKTCIDQKYGNDNGDIVDQSSLDLSKLNGQSLKTKEDIKTFLEAAMKKLLVEAGSARFVTFASFDPYAFFVTISNQNKFLTGDIKQALEDVAKSNNGKQREDLPFLKIGDEPTIKQFATYIVRKMLGDLRD